VLDGAGWLDCGVIGACELGRCKGVGSRFSLGGGGGASVLDARAEVMLGG